MKQSLFFLLLALNILIWPSSAYSKGSPDRIVITGGGLERPIEIVDRKTLKSFDPWTGQFVDWTQAPVAEPRDQNQCYEVRFYMKWEGRHSAYDRGNLKLIYTVQYCAGRNGESGSVYLPGKDDKYSVNAGTIWRKDDDGKWHRTSHEWDQLINRVTAVSKPIGNSWGVLPMQLFLPGTGSVWISLAPHFSEVTNAARRTTSRFNGFH
jgi:hypothetical protein